MKIPKDLVPQKAVAADLCVSVVTLWRARQSGIPGFPEPVVRKNMIFWRKDDVEQLEEALLRFEGRGKFEEDRIRTRRNESLMKTQLKRKRTNSSQRRNDQRQLALF